MKPTAPRRSGDEIFNCLRQVKVLGALDESLLRELTGEMEFGSLTAGEVLFQKDDPADALYIVLDGELEAFLPREGASLLVLSSMGTGAAVGEIQVLTGGPRTASVRASRTSELARLPRAAVAALADRHPEVVAGIADLVHERLRRDQLVGFLSNLFGDIDQSVLYDIERIVEWIHLERGERLFSAGDPGDCLYLTVGGRLNVVITDADGNPKVLGEIGRGEVVGEMAVFTGEPRTAAVYAIRDSELAKITKACFEELVQRHPRLLTAITSTLVARMRRDSSPTRAKKPIVNIAVVPIGADVPLTEFTARLVESLSAAESTVHLSADRLDDYLDMPGAAELPEDSPYNIRISALLDQLESSNRFVVYQTDPDAATWTGRCIRQADEILLVGRAGASGELAEIERDLLSRENRLTAARKRLILLHDDDSTLPTNTRGWLENRDVIMHHHLRWNREADFARLARFLRGRAIGLVLGGGGARGMAHIGVIRALLEAGVPIDMIGGTSAGGVIATEFAMGMDPDTMHRKTRKAFDEGRPFRDFTLPIVSIVAAGRMERLTREMYGEARIEDLWLNSFCVSCNLTTSETVVHRNGPVWRAVRATSALPGISVPVVESEELLVDGGVVDNLPGQVMQELCGGPVILVDVSPDEDLRVGVSEIPTTGKILSSWILPNREKIKVPTIMELIVRTAVLSSVKRRGEAQRIAALYLKPQLGEFKLLEFDAFDKIVDKGYRYAQEKIAGWENRDQHVDDLPEGDPR